MKKFAKQLGICCLILMLPNIAVAADTNPTITCQMLWQKDPMNVNDRPIVLFSKTASMPNISVTSDRARVYGGEMKFVLPNGVSLLANYYGYAGVRNFSGANLYIQSGASFLNSTSSFNNFESIKKTKATVSTTYITSQGPVYSGQCWFNNRKPE